MAKKKPKQFTSAQKAEFDSWVQGQLDDGDGLPRIIRKAKDRYGAFDISMIIELIMAIIKKWLESRK